MSDDDRTVSRLTLILLLLLTAPAWALETDQFTVPDKPLPDLGAALDAKLLTELERVIADANASRAANLASAQKARTAKWRRIYTRRADEAVSADAIAEALYDRVATIEVPRCRLERWLEDKESGRAAMLQNTGIRDSIYGGPWQRPPLLIEVSPTVNLYGQYVGVDKVGHFVQQGHEYFNAYRDAIADGKSNETATRAAVDHGVGQEHGFYGEITIGVYSNADLASNYAGLLFYRNLMEAVRLGDTLVEPMLTWDGQRLVLTPRAREGLSKPFITEHWSEAMNPSRYAAIWRRSIRVHVAERIGDWMAFHRTTADAEKLRLERVQRLFGVDYGHRGSDADLVTVVNAGPSPGDPITASVEP
jgi:hypothetical protein